MGLHETVVDKLLELIRRVTPKRGPMGRPRRQDRQVLSGILWVLLKGARWCDLPAEYPPYQTCHRRFQEWVQTGVWQSVLASIAQEFHTRGLYEYAEGFIDGTFIAARKGGLQSARPNVARGPRLWPWLMVPVFLSPLLWQALRPMRSRLWRQLSPPLMPPRSRGV